MSKFDTYVFILCLVVFIALTALFSFLIYSITKLSIKLIRTGTEDKTILNEYNKEKLKKKSSHKVIDSAVAIIFCMFFVVVFGFLLYVNIQEDAYFESIPTIKVVATSSMEKKNEKNTYLFKNDLNNQIAMFDLILTYKAPEEKDLKLYDIVVYEIDDIYLVHRIVGIEEPNEKHPNERHFLLQGDAVDSPDRYPVLYSQIKAVYKGQKVPFVGSFVFFMQSPAGYLCIVLVLFAVIATPLLEKKLKKEKMARIEIIQKKNKWTIKNYNYSKNLQLKRSSNKR